MGGEGKLEKTRSPEGAKTARAGKGRERSVAARSSSLARRARARGSERVRKGRLSGARLIRNRAAPPSGKGTSPTRSSVRLVKLSALEESG